MAVCMREEGIGPEHEFKFDVSSDIIAMAKVRQPANRGLLLQVASGLTPRPTVA